MWPRTQYIYSRAVMTVKFFLFYIDQELKETLFVEYIKYKHDNIRVVN